MVPTARLREPFDRHPLAREATLALAAVGVLGLWVSLIVTFVEQFVPIGAIDVPGGAGAGLAVHAIATSIFVIAGMLLFVGAYTSVRDIDVSPTLPDRQVVAFSGGAVVASVALVGALGLVVTVAGPPFSEVTGTSFGPGASLSITVLVTAIGLFVGIPAYVLVTHVLLQRSIQRAGRPLAAIAIPTIVVGALGPTAVLNMSPVQATVGAGLVAVSIALPVIAAETYERRWLTAVTALPAALVVTGVFLERVSDLPGVAGVAHLLAMLCFVAVGAYAYERTGSALPSALAYATFVVAIDLVHYAIQVGF